MQASVKSWITKAKIAIISDTDACFTENIGSSEIWSDEYITL